MPTVKESFDAMPSRFRSDKATGTSAVIQYDVSGDGGGTWNAVIKDGACTVNQGAAPTPNLQMLFMSGKLKIKGDMGLAMKLGSMFSM
jgi:putative sterol carrier protein